MTEKQLKDLEHQLEPFSRSYSPCPLPNHQFIFSATSTTAYCPDDQYCACGYVTWGELKKYERTAKVSWKPADK